jgi:hypothetical protein
MHKNIVHGLLYIICRYILYFMKYEVSYLCDKYSRIDEREFQQVVRY